MSSLSLGVETPEQRSAYLRTERLEAAQAIASGNLE